MRCEPHPISGFIYRNREGGRVEVENPRNGQTGLFSWDGTWLEGDVTQADLHFLRFIGGPDLAPDKDVIWSRLPLEKGGEVPPDGYFFGRIPDGVERVVKKYDPAPAMATDDGMRSATHVELEYFLDNDRKPEAVPDVYKLHSPMEGGPRKVDTARYTDKAAHDREVERIWGKVWQMVCREDDIPEVGDFHVYNVADLSWIVVRTGENTFKAHRNACLHRGRTLADCDGHKARVFRCPYHGWSWNIDGSVKEIVCEWDFPGLEDEVAQLPGAQVDTWGGWVFINPDPDAGSLSDFLGPVMMQHYERFEPASFWKQVHVTRPIPTNWKSGMEAFMEGWHVVATHPQLMLLGFENGADRYDVFGHWGRAGHVTIGRSSAHRSIFVDREELLAEYRMGADGAREYLRKIIGDDIDKFSDAELNDTSYCDLFPNFHPWMGFSRINFRFRPVGNDPDKAVMDVIYLAPWPKDKPKPPAAKPHVLSEDEPWSAAEELGSLARILDQDVGNMVGVQKGLKTKQPPHIWFSQYQEGKIRNFHRNYDRWMGLEDETEA